MHIAVSDQQLFLHYPLSEFLIIADFPSFFNKFTPGASVIPVVSHFRLSDVAQSLNRLGLLLQAWVLVPDSG